jgi:hypothetical protein
MNRIQFIERAEERTEGYLQKWMKNPAFRAAVQQPNPDREGSKHTLTEREKPKRSVA